ncbi:MAG: FKBP-type peptidyl-prolyl cis-trans isomerase [Planctomycetota bacterium]
MRALCIAIAITCAAGGLVAAENGGGAVKNDEQLALSDEDKQVIEDFSRVLGMQVAAQIKSRDLDKDAVVAGIDAGMEGEASPSPQQMQQLFQAHQQIMAKKSKLWKQNAGLPLSTGQEFYEAYKQQDDVTVTDSGLAYEVLEPGPEGAARPGASDEVRVEYTGRRTTGEIFDASERHGQAIEFELDKVIPGWTEGVQLMPVGSTYRFVVPGDLAYGEFDPQSSQPTGTLIFDVELLDIIDQSGSGATIETGSKTATGQGAEEGAEEGETGQGAGE